MTKALVTGAAGFIGSHVCDHLISNGYEVVALDDLSGGFEDNLSSKAQFVKGSILDTDLIDRLFKEHQFEYVFHLAAYAAEGLSHFIRRYNYTNNLIGSINLINASINSGTVKCFVFTSSIAVYGRNQLPMQEDMTPLPEDPYGISKLAVEQDLKSAHEMFGLNFIIFRPHNVYGERQNIGDPYRNVVGIFMNQIMQGKRLTIFGEGLQTRAFSHIDDVAPVIAKSIEVPEAYNHVFNIGADTPYSVKELVTLVCDAFDVSEQIDYLDARNEVTHAYSSHEKVLSYFGHMIKNIPLKEGIERMVEDAKKKGPRVGEKFGNIEIEKNMPPAWKKLI
ncbi:MAG TPA: NAD-dependent epimerase/dehydratase family protein [Chitinophagaceae bacterium]|jgi:UDP-glucose 4-epimerase|nr:NAD-dependent epimerase/dehydratase family protein [Chitinophagaceae bacterium]